MSTELVLILSIFKENLIKVKANNCKVSYIKFQKFVGVYHPIRLLFIEHSILFMILKRKEKFTGQKMAFKFQ